MVDDLNYNFHDAVVIQCEYLAEDVFILVLRLYEIYYPEKTNVRIIFSGIFNGIKVRELSKILNEQAIEADWIGARINSLYLDKKMESADGNLYFFLNVDGYKPLRIHCRKIDVSDE